MVVHIACLHSELLLSIWQWKDGKLRCLFLMGALSESQGASIGDIDGDGQLEVVVGTTSGRVYALLGADGTDKAGFPFQTRGRIMAPVLLTQVHCHTQHGIDPERSSFSVVIQGVLRIQWLAA